MEDARAKIIEKQLDTLAGSVRRHEEQLRTLVDALMRPDVADAMQLTAADLGKLKFPKNAAFFAHDHEVEREKELRQTARDEELDRLIRERQERERNKR